MPRRTAVYAIFKPLVWIASRLYFRRVEINGRENVPKGVPVVLAANHQNALMDALMCCISNGPQVTFLTRADIFKASFANKMLRAFNMLPVYRKRDQVDQLEKNKETFDICHQRLANKSMLGIFPEGNHGGAKKLRPLRKGLARLVFGAEEEFDYNLDIHIVPVGIEYGHYFKPQKSIVLNFGPAIPVSEFTAGYKEHGPTAYNSLMKRVQSSLDQLMTNVRNPEVYDALIGLENMEIAAPTWGLTKSKFEALKKVESSMREFEKSESPNNPAKKLVQAYTAYQNQLEKFGLRDWLLTDNKKSRVIIGPILLALLSPLVMLGIILNILPHLLVSSVVKKSVKDPLFIHSIHMVLGTFIYPIFWLLQAVTIHFVVDLPWSGTAGLLLAPLCGLIARYGIKVWKRIGGFLRFAKLKSGSPDLFSTLCADREKLAKIVAQHSE